MASEPWIKLRESIHTDPRVLTMAGILARTAINYVMHADRSRDLLGETPFVTRDVMRDVTVAGLSRVWIAANRHTRDGTFNYCTLAQLDTLSGIPGFGEAMAAVGYAVYDSNSNTVTLPAFAQHNSSAKSGRDSNSAERARRYRDRKNGASVTRDVTRDGDVTSRVTSHQNVTLDKTRLDSTTTTTTAARDRGCTISEAREWAIGHNKGNTDGIEIPMPVLTAWHDDRETSGWVKVTNGSEIPIRDWQADLRGYARKWLNNERSMPATRNGHSPRPAPTPIKLSTEPKGGF
jgi:hypothetical protein